MKKILLALFSLLVLQNIVQASSIEGPFIFEWSLRQHLIIGKYNTTGPFVAVNMNGVELKGFQRLAGDDEEMNERGYYTEQDGILMKSENGIYSFYNSATNFSKIGSNYVSATLFSEGKAIVSLANEHLNIIDINGKVIGVLNDYKGNAIEMAEEFSEGLAAVKNSKNLWGFVDAGGNMVIEPQFRRVNRFNESYCVVEVMGKDRILKVGIIDTKGNYVFPLTPNIIVNDRVNNGVIGFKKSSKSFGVMDVQGKEVIAPNTDFNWIGPFNKKGLALYHNGQNFGIINLEGEIITRARYSMIQLLDNSYIGIAVEKYSSTVELFDYKGKLLHDFKYLMVLQVANGNYRAFDNMGSCILLDKHFKEIGNKTIISSDRRFDFTQKTPARTDYYDIQKIVSNKQLALAYNGIAGLKKGADVKKMIEVCKLHKPNNFFSPYNQTGDEDDVDYDEYITSPSREHLFGSLTQVAMSSIVSEIEMAQRMVDSLAAMEAMMVVDETEQYADSLEFLSAGKMQEIKYREGNEAHYELQLIFDDFIKINHFEETKNSCNVCKLKGTAINTKAKLTGYKLKINLLGKASGKESELITHLTNEFTRLGFDVAKKDQEYVIYDAKNNNKKVGKIRAILGSNLEVEYNF
ncbi:MAG: WG repeat-containing protein [Bacteroidota bacterium]